MSKGQPREHRNISLKLLDGSLRYTIILTSLCWWLTSLMCWLVLNMQSSGWQSLQSSDCWQSLLQSFEDLQSWQSFEDFWQFSFFFDLPLPTSEQTGWKKQIMRIWDQNLSFEEDQIGLPLNGVEVERMISWQLYEYINDDAFEKW